MVEARVFTDDWGAEGDAEQVLCGDGEEKEKGRWN